MVSAAYASEGAVLIVAVGEYVGADGAASVAMVSAAYASEGLF